MTKSVALKWYEYRIIPVSEEEMKANGNNKPWRTQVTFIHPLYGECMLLENAGYKVNSYPLYIRYKLVYSGIIHISKAEDAGIGNIPNRVFKEFGY